MKRLITTLMLLPFLAAGQYWHPDSGYLPILPSRGYGHNPLTEGAFLGPVGGYRATAPTIPEGEYLVSVDWNITDGVAVPTNVVTEPIPPVPLYDGALVEQLAPLLDAHPDCEDVPEPGMFYRLLGPDGEDQLWYRRKSDCVGSQLSAHDAQGRPIVRTLRANGEVETIHVGVLERATRRTIAETVSDEATAEDVDGLEDLFAEWRPDIAVRAREFYRYDNRIFRVIQAHTTQADWTPDVVPALFVEILPAGESGCPPWVQPTGAHDAYNIGDCVEHAGQVWDSTINANTVEPGTHPGFDWWVARP